MSSIIQSIKYRFSNNSLAIISIKIYRLLRYNSLKIIRYVISRIDFNELINEKQFLEKYPLAPDELGIISCWGLGDTVMVAGLAHNFIKNGYAKSIVLIVKPMHEYIVSCFPSVSKVYLLDHNIDYLDHHTNSLNFSRNFSRNNNYIYAHFYNREMVELLGFKNITLIDVYRAVLKLPKDAKMEQPRLLTAENLYLIKKLFQKNDLIEGKTVILAPDANSIVTFANSFWKQLAKKLTDNGYKIILNSNKHDYLIDKNIKFIDIPLSQIVSFVSLAGNCISVRSGLCDLLSIYHVNLIVLYPYLKTNDSMLIDSFSISKMWVSKNIKEIEVELLSEQDNFNTDQTMIINDIIGELQ